MGGQSRHRRQAVTKNVPGLKKKGFFKPGHKYSTGRPAGSTNKVPTVLKEAIMLAAELEGWDGRGLDGLTGWLRHLAREDIRSFAMLVGKVLPYTIAAEREVKVEVTYRTVAEIRRELLSRGINMESIARVLHQPPEVIENEGIEFDDDDDLTIEPDKKPDDAA